MSNLILARHGATPFNEAGIWTGLTDIDMSEAGYKDVQAAARIVSRYAIDIALSSALKRARNTAKIILEQQPNPHIALLETASLNEKDYGKYTGESKQKVKSEVGEDVFMQIRRSWDYKIEGGESLQAVHERLLPIHTRVVLPLLEDGHTVLVASHNNTLRAYVKEIEQIPAAEAHKIELGTAEVRIYGFADGIFSQPETHSIGAVH